MPAYHISDYIQSPLNAAISNVNFLVFSKLGSQITTLLGVIDAIPEEQHVASVGVSDYPIETGATLTDHAFIKPIELNITGIISDVLINTFTTLATPFRDREGWERILLQLQRRELVTIVTLLKTYNDMLITRVSPRKNARIGGRGMQFSMQLRQVLIAETVTNLLPKDQVTGDAANRSGVVNGGEKQSDQPTDSQQNSWLASLVDFIEG